MDGIPFLFLPEANHLPRPVPMPPPPGSPPTPPARVHPRCPTSSSSWSDPVIAPDTGHLVSPTTGTCRRHMGPKAPWMDGSSSKSSFSMALVRSRAPHHPGPGLSDPLTLPVIRRLPVGHSQVWVVPAPDIADTELSDAHWTKVQPGASISARVSRDGEPSFSLGGPAGNPQPYPTQALYLCL